jgi:phosphonate transport system substrate-binding protein
MKPMNPMRVLRDILLPLALVAMLCLQPQAGAADLTIGIFPRRDAATTVRMFLPLAEKLELQLGRRVHLETASDFEHFHRRLTDYRFDLVHLNQYQYIKAQRELGYQAIARNQEFGQDTIRGAIYVRWDSGIQSLQQLRGKHIMFGGGPSAMMSYLVPSYLLRQAGLGPDDYRASFANSPPNSLLATYLQQADAGGAGDVVIDLPVVRKRIDVRQLRILATSEPLPHLPWAVSPRLDPSLRDRLQQALVGLSDSEAGRSALQAAALTGIESAVDSDYDSCREIIASQQPES